MKVFKKDNKIIIEIPFWSKRSNPYMPDEDVGEYQTLIGIMYKDNGNDEIGFAETIDMDYNDKGDQWTEIKYHWWEEKKEFIELCEKLGIGFFEYPTCETCGKSIFGSFTVDSDGKNLCFECETKMNQRSN